VRRLPEHPVAPIEPADRRYPGRPVVGVGAVILAGDDRVVLVRRAHEPRISTWTLPGGAVETGETLEEAVAREVREETGLDVKVGPLVEVVEHIEHDGAGRALYHFVIVDYVCWLRGGELQAGSDAAGVRLATLPELDAPDIDERTRAVIARARAVAAGPSLGAAAPGEAR
jgi:mutator protein MutT